jgi:hypothetical protein
MASKFLQLAVVLTVIVALSAKSCKDSQFYANDGSCVDCPVNCTTCANGQYCLSCVKEHFLVSQPAGVSCLSCSQIYFACTSCLSNVACLSCLEGYFLSNNQCRPCAQGSIGCNKCSLDGATCNQCIYPYILLNGQCVSGTVSDITNGGSLPSSPTQPGPAVVTLANGTVVPAVYDINGCNQVQVFNNGYCSKKIVGCVLYQPNGLCQYCNASYLVTIFGDCSPATSILRCEQGFWLNPVTGICTAVNVACDWYYPNNGSCFNCSKGYIMDETRNCVPSIKCDSRSFFYQGTCVEVPTSCAEFTSDGVCTKCAKYYNLEGGLCTLSLSYRPKNDCTFPCKTCHFENLSYCYSCIINYHLLDAKYGTCVAYLK